MKASRTKNSERASQSANRRKSDAQRTSVDAQVPVTARDRLAGKWFEKLVALQARLRAPGGCPWDREQTHESLRKFLIEETYEVLDAMESGDPENFASELGDLLLQVIFHSIVAEEAGRFTIAGVIESVHAKMVRRHPHVFGNAKAKTAGDVLRNWEQLKAAERAGSHRRGDSKTAGTAPSQGEAAKNDAGSALIEDSLLGGIPRALPAVLEAYQLTRRASHVGFDWENAEGVFEKLEEEERELREVRVAGAAATRAGSAETSHGRLEEETGDLLFAAVNLARFLGVDPEIALKRANAKFQRRFRWMEQAAAREGRPFAGLPRGRKEELWNASKSAESEGSSAARLR